MMLYFITKEVSLFFCKFIFKLKQAFILMSPNEEKIKS